MNLDHLAHEANQCARREAYAASRNARKQQAFNRKNKRRRRK